MRGFSWGKGADTHIDADDQPNPCGRSALNNIATHVITFADAVGDVEIASTSAEFDSCLQDNDGHGAVNVVVAINENWFFAVDGGVNAIHSGLQTCHQERRVQMRE